MVVYSNEDGQLVISLRRVALLLDYMIERKYRVGEIAQHCEVSRTTLWRVRTRQHVSPKTAYILAVELPRILPPYVRREWERKNGHITGSAFFVDDDKQ